MTARPDTVFQPRCMPLAECRVGDFEEAALVPEWKYHRDPQPYQPQTSGSRGSSPFNVRGFDPSRPIWQFRRCHSPRPHDSSWVWQRVS
ncbi:hypothetical protein HNR46_004124 [Haloferula luteola]|uniref:Uncharacterized protein n=1 Tax=Haloferula luteola TaxID=595692 RepID=A0A840VJ21_9BACT|nr:hypothetical protein [Haloferula luteola]MBB5353860.1 hypothetical protein [Haloferula luteola]